MKKILLVLSILFLFSGKVYAECSGSEKIDLNQKAANIKVKYEIDTEYKEMYDGVLATQKIKVNIYNLSEEFYLIMKNKNTKEEKKFTSKDAVDGVITLETDDLSEVVNYVFEVKALIDVTSCPGQKFKTLYLTTPRRNSYSERGICGEYQEFSYCKEFVTVPDVTEEEFQEKLENYVKIENKNKSTQDQNDQNSILEFIVKYKWYVISILIIIASISTGVILVNRKKQRELGL